MAETTQEYKDRIISYVGDQDALVLQQVFPNTLEAVIHQISPDHLSIRPKPTKWSIREIVAHLADDELVGAYRIRLILSAPGVDIQAFDQDKWASIGNYNTTPIEHSLLLFRQLREANLTLFATLTPEQWQRHGVHAELGKETIRDIAQYYAGHDINHLNQITSIMATWPTQ